MTRSQEIIKHLFRQTLMHLVAYLIMEFAFQEQYKLLYLFLQACYLDLAGEGIKEASKTFQQAAWVFEHLKTLVIALDPNETTCDFNIETLSMLSSLMLAQAQYLFYRKASDS